ncbi:MAG: hypothetical protein IKR85_08970 [Clostridia bacterium]|nr:hypothetical protein [Clostridia bacterium]
MKAASPRRVHVLVESPQRAHVLAESPHTRGVNQGARQRILRKRGF